MKVVAQRPILWTEELQAAISIYFFIPGFTRVENNGDRGRTKLQFGREFEVI